MKDPHCKNLSRKMSDYIDGSLDFKTLSKITSHLKECKPCVVLFKTIRKTVGILGSLKVNVSTPPRAKNHLREKLKSVSR